MTASPATDPAHGKLMDGVYRRQKHIYDATRKFFLFGRDTMIAGLGCSAGMSVLEIGCGTGRNLDLIGRHWPGTQLYGIDISREMLDQARRRLGSNARLARGDAGGFDAQALLGRGTFDRVTISYALSMIPCWEAALAHAAGLLAEGGSLHIVDFGDLDGMARPLRRALQAWLGAFHVSVRGQLLDVAAHVADAGGLSLSLGRGPLGYYSIAVLRKPGDLPQDRRSGMTPSLRAHKRH
ncbi:class I SAM-dependent methyltransferase [Novosphingobium sp.]|uniref:class I SAM-dependent methyltransferase n=1 Tax=Novosphingobium sp. TaxID=1874826 RepID=UPI0026306E0C|nr:class I SAM-dependent methyltransferase [Novosphingobium sp.]